MSSTPGGSAASLVQLLTTDLVGITRGRSMAGDDAVTWGVQGVGWVPANMALDPFDAIATPNPWGPIGDLRLKPDMSSDLTIDEIPGRPPLRFLLSDIVELDGSPWSCCPREFLRRALDDLTAAGLRILASFEHEFTFTDDKARPAPAFSLVAHRRREPFLSTLYASLRVARVEPETVLPEFGPNQYEISSAAVRGLAAADRAIITREVTREFADAFGYALTFSPKPRPDAASNGVHIHFSFRDAANQPATYDPARPGGLSAAAGPFAAGVLRHMAALCAITAPSPVSYLRLVPQHWSAAYACIGERNREAALRICHPPSSAEDFGRGFNLEYRPTDATANPYLALGAIIRAGLAGIRDRLPTPPMVNSDPATLSEQDRTRLGVTRLPTSLAAALQALAADTEVRGWFPPPLLQAMMSVKAREAALANSLSPEELCRRYTAVY
jgi:glutamine synthetase